jgi:hypothetical protein
VAQKVAAAYEDVIADYRREHAPAEHDKRSTRADR